VLDFQENLLQDSHWKAERRCIERDPVEVGSGDERLWS
jgi:hypothetical protein